MRILLLLSQGLEQSVARLAPVPVMSTRESTQLKYFVPDPGESVMQPQRPAKDTGLPPGMSRG